MRFHTPAFLTLRRDTAAPAVTPRSAPVTKAAPVVRHDVPHYNFEAGAFEARVDVTRAGRTFRYPVRVTAPHDADPRWVSAALIRRALGLSDSPRLH